MITLQDIWNHRKEHRLLIELPKDDFLNWVGLTEEQIDTGDIRIFDNIKPPLNQSGGITRFPDHERQDVRFSWRLLRDYGYLSPGKNGRLCDDTYFTGGGKELFEAMLQGLIVAYELHFYRKRDHEREKDNQCTDH